MIKILRRSLSDLWQLVSPVPCPVCSRVLTQGEEHICTECFSSLQNTGYLHIHSNPMEQKIHELTGIHIPSGALLGYSHHSTVGKIISAFKYHNSPSLALWAGQMMGSELAQEDRFSSYKMIVPIPLHPTRLKTRGYNQAELLCRGIASQIRDAQVLNALIRNQATSTQTALGKLSRWENTQNIFSLPDPELVQNRDIMLVDDVFTTGATLCSAIAALRQGEPRSMAIVTLAVGNV